MSPLLPFPPKPRDFAGLDASLVKGDRTRRFWVRVLPYQKGFWKGQIWFDGRTHRQLITDDLLAIVTFRSQCEDEIRELERDGWTRVPSLRALKARRP